MNIKKQSEIIKDRYIAPYAEMMDVVSDVLCQSGVIDPYEEEDGYDWQ